MFEDFFVKLSEKNEKGTLTVGEATFGYYRLRNGRKAGKVIIITCASIDEKRICFYANELTWAYIENIKDILCEAVRPTFSQGQATWYNDNSEEPSFYEW